MARAMATGLPGAMRWRLLVLLIPIVTFLVPGVSQAAVRTWTGLGLTNNWSEPANWTALPGTGDVATFNATSVKPATIDGNINVAGIAINAGYSGTITQEPGVTVTLGASNFVQAAGTFAGGDSDITINGAFTLSAGSFTATSGITTVALGFTHTAGGTFTPNNGTVVFSGAAATINVAVTETFFNVTISKNPSVALTVTNSDTLVVTGTLTLTDGNLNQATIPAAGTIDAQADVTHGSGFDGGSGRIHITGAAARTINLTGGGNLPGVLLNAANVTVNGPASGTTTFAGAVTSFNFQAGTVTGGAGDMTFNLAYTQSGGSFTASSGTTTFALGFTHTAGGTFTHNNGAVVFTGAAATINVATSEAFYDLTISKNPGVSLTVTNSDTMVVTGTLTLTDGNLNQTTIPAAGTIDAQAGVTHGAGFDGGTGRINITGAASRTINLTGGGRLPGVLLNAANVTVNGPASGTTTFARAVTLQDGIVTGGAGDMTFNLAYTQSGGTFTGGTGAVTVTSTFTLSGGIYTATAGTTTLALGFTHAAGGTFTHNSGTVVFTGAAATINVAVPETFFHLTISKNTGIALTVANGDTLVVTGTVTLTDGTLNQATIPANGSINAQAGVTHGAGFDGGTGRINITGAASRTINLTGGGSLPGVLLNAANVTLNGPAFGTTTFMGPATSFALQAGTVTGWAGAMTFNGAYTQSGGSFTGGAGAMTVAGAFTLSAGTFTASSGTTSLGLGFTHTAGGTFTHNGGTVVFTGAAGTIDVAASETFDDFTISTNDGVALTVANSDTLIVAGTLTLTDGNLDQATVPPSGTIAARGNLIQATTFDGGTGALFIDSTGVQTFTGGGSTSLGTLPAVTVSKTGGSLTLSGIVRTTNPWTISAGTVETGTSTLAGTGSFTLSSGATLGIGSPDGIHASGATGNIQVSGARSFGTGANYVYNGTAAQATGTGLPSSVAGLTIDNGSGVAVSPAVDTTVTTALSLQSGPLNSGSQVVIVPSGSSVTAGSGWVSATGSGGLQQNFALGSNVSRTFPVGTATAAAAVSVTIASVTTAGDLIVKATAGDHVAIGTSTLNASQSVNLNWTLTDGASPIAFTSYSAVFNFNNPADLDAGANAVHLIVGKYNPSTWIYPAVGTRTSTSTQGTGITSTFGDFQLAQSGVAAKIRVETSADGTGSVVPAQNVAAGGPSTVYAIGRDGNDNFVASMAADSWSLTGITGGVVAGDLVAAGDNQSAVFTGHVVGTAAVRAAKAGLASTDSGILTVIAGAASKLAFGTQPSNTGASASIDPALTVRILDAYDNLTTSTASVTAAIGTNPGGGVLSGTLTPAAVGGTATFGDLAIDTPGILYTLTAASPGLTGTTSGAFNITPSFWVNSATGSDANPGTLVLPFATIGKAASVMGVVGTVLVQVGASQSGSPYPANTVVTVAMAGTILQQTRFQGVATGGVLPLITGTDPAIDAGFDVQGDYVTIDGFEIRNTLVGVYSEPSTTGARISQNYVVSGHLAYGIILDTTANAWVHDNRVEQVSGGGSFFGIWDYAGSGNVIELNRVRGHGSDGIVSHYSTGLTIRRNILKNNLFGIHISNAIGPVTLYHNTVDGSAFLGIYAEQSPVTVTSRNNIVVNGGYGWAWDGVGTISSDYDDVYNNASDYNYTVPVTPGANSISADPIFVQTIDPTAYDYYRLSAGSPCIGAGIDVGYGRNIGAVP